MEYNSELVRLVHPCRPSVCLIDLGTVVQRHQDCCAVVHAWFPKVGNCLVQDGGSGWTFGSRCSTSLNGVKTGAKCLLEGAEIYVWREDTGNV